MAFGKNQHAVPTVHGFACIGKAFSETRLARKGEKIEQGNAQCPTNLIVNSCEQTAEGGRSAQSLQSFAAGGRGKAMAKVSRQRGEDEAGINIVNVVGNHKHWALNVSQVLTAVDARPTQQHYCRKHEEVIRQQP